MLPTRHEALARLARFLPRAGRDYARQRNFDRGPDDRTNVSVLSPYIRHRLITEEEVVRAVLGRHSLAAAEKFIQEVCWRTYWKGWLEHHPSVWDDYQTAVRDDAAALDPARRALLERAIAGRTGIACFDAWVRELVDTGYLHNHARMWFASLWIFTLELPWTLGADFFRRHLLDGDPASNTLSWRWVGGLQTRGKTYLARADNIATYTDGRFPRVEGLAERAHPLDGAPPPPPRALAPADGLPSGGRFILLMTDDDLGAGTWGVPKDRVAAVAVLAGEDPTLAPHVTRFRAGARADALAAATRDFGCPGLDLTSADAGNDLIASARESETAAIVTMAPPVGPGRIMLDRLVGDLARADLHLYRLGRRWDELFWPHARKGFFHLKDRIPGVLSALGIEPAAVSPQGELFR